MSQYVQYIVVRKDLVEQMGIGKTAAQVAHASLGVVVEKVKRTYSETIQAHEHGPRHPISVPVVKEDTQLIDDPAIHGWFRGSFTKLVVYVKTKQKLLNLQERLDRIGIRTKLIYDAARTMLKPEEVDGTVLTCMGVIPLHRDKVPKDLKKLRLLEQ